MASIPLPSSHATKERKQQGVQAGGSEDHYVAASEAEGGANKQQQQVGGCALVCVCGNRTMPTAHALHAPRLSPLSLHPLCSAPHL